MYIRYFLSVCLICIESYVRVDIEIHLVSKLLPKFNSAAKHMGYTISAVKRDTTETHNQTRSLI